MNCSATGFASAGVGVQRACELQDQAHVPDHVLVHGYVEVDDRLVVDHLDERDELRRFVASMTRLLAEPTPES